jgi:hypothetical protein
MKKLSLILTAAAGLALLALATPTFAAEKGKETTLTGEAKCAKCALKESDKCQTVIQTEGKNGKTVTYYLADNEAAKSFHPTVCHGPKKVKATGVVKRTEAGKREFTVTKIEEVKEAK